MPNKAVTASTGTINLGSLGLLVGSLTAHPVDWIGASAGAAGLVLSSLTLFAHLKGNNPPMATQNDVNDLVSRIRGAWEKIKSGNVVARAEVDLSEAIKLAEELESEAEKVTGTSPTNVPPASDPTNSATSGGTPPASSGDFSKLTS